MVAPLFCPRSGPGASSKAWSLLLLLLLLLPPTRDTIMAHRCPFRKEVLNRSVVCGQRNMPGKITGGMDAPEKKWPWQVSLHYAGFHICGGSIIDEYWVLSAAHCFSKDNHTEAFDVYVGLVHLKIAGSHTQWFEVNKIVMHHTYEVYHPVGGDIALVQLKSRIVFSDSVLPICLATPDMNLQNLTCWATGWGLISPKGHSSDHLQEVQVPLIPVILCQLLYGHPSYILPDMICAGDIRDTKTMCEVHSTAGTGDQTHGFHVFICLEPSGTLGWVTPEGLALAGFRAHHHGDSGGPLVCEFNRVWVQVGIVSWGRGCMFPMYPAVYTRVSYFSTWIQHQITHTPPPCQPLPTLSSTLGASVSVLMTMMAFLTML